MPLTDAGIARQGMAEDDDDDNDDDDVDDDDDDDDHNYDYTSDDDDEGDGDDDYDGDDDGGAPSEMDKTSWNHNFSAGELFVLQHSSPHLT